MQLTHSVRIILSGGFLMFALYLEKILIDPTHYHLSQAGEHPMTPVVTGLVLCAFILSTSPLVIQVWTDMKERKRPSLKLAAVGAILAVLAVWQLALGAIAAFAWLLGTDLLSLRAPRRASLSTRHDDTTTAGSDNR